MDDFSRVCIGGRVINHHLPRRKNAGQILTGRDKVAVLYDDILDLLSGTRKQVLVCQSTVLRFVELGGSQVVDNLLVHLREHEGNFLHVLAMAFTSGNGSRG